MKIGNASYGSTSKFTQRKYFKLKDGESVFRILPPLGELADQGRWSVFWSVHYGYKNTENKMRVFASPLVKNRKNGMVEVPDAAMERIDSLKAAQAEAKKAGDKAKVERLDTLLDQFNLDNNHYMNVVDEHGNIGVLKLRHRAKLALEAKIKSLRESGVDPLSVEQGRFFVFRRSGTGLDTTFQVEIKQEKLNVPGVGDVSRDVVHKLTPELIGRLSAEAAELHKLFKAPTSEEVAQIVGTSNLLTGISTAVDAVFASKAAEETAPSTTTQAPVQAAPVQATPAPTAVSAAPTAKVEMAPAVAQVSAPTPVEPVKSEPIKIAPAVVTESVSALSDEEFLKSMGL